MSDSSQPDFDPAQINWLQALAKDYLKQRKRDRFFRFLFKFVIVGVLILAVLQTGADKAKTKILKDHVAVIRLEGPIFARSRASAASLVASLKEAAANENVKAIMLDINSPGGSPVQADEMYHALRQFKKAHPKIAIRAVCSDLCASAAYYVAAGADDIYANPASMVGSIGVIFNGFGFTEAMEKLGVQRRMITAGKYKGFLDPFSPEKAEDKQQLQTMLDLVHQQFINAVKQGRGQRLLVTDQTFSGLLWTGEQAKKMGLIDGFGSIRTGFKDLPRVVYSSGESWFEKINRQLGESASAALLGSATNAWFNLS